MTRTLSLDADNISTRLQRIAELARKAATKAFTSLAHYIDVDLLHEAFRRTRKDGATGVDGRTGAEYAEHLEDNLASLLDRFKSGSYVAPPVRRVYVPKADGTKTRPIGIPTFEDKVLQRAATMVLEAVYEQEFLDCSYGYRPGRSARDALKDLHRGLTKMGGGWILEVDIRSFFDTISHRQLRSILDQRVRDGVIRRTINKWLAAGVMEGTQLHHPDDGTPQGGVISPLLANIYLHEVVDRWFARDVQPRLRGRSFMIRFADDMVLAFSAEADARKVMDVLPKRMGRYGLTLHPTKTRLVHFRPPRERENEQGQSERGFEFLGLTHYWGRTRWGSWAVMRKTAPDRFRRAVANLARWARQHLHDPVAEQHQQLVRKLRGHDNYYGFPDNVNALKRLRHELRRIWHKWLNRRSTRAHMTWERFKRLLDRYPLPWPAVAAQGS
jgi:group II intron reverse transcriptase/maturase